MQIKNNVLSKKTISYIPFNTKAHYLIKHTK